MSVVTTGWSRRARRCEIPRPAAIYCNGHNAHER